MTEKYVIVIECDRLSMVIYQFLKCAQRISKKNKLILLKITKKELTAGYYSLRNRATAINLFN